MKDALSVPGQTGALIQSVLSASAGGTGDYEEKNNQKQNLSLVISLVIIFSCYALYCGLP